jgi:hypothetical protein
VAAHQVAERLIERSLQRCRAIESAANANIASKVVVGSGTDDPAPMELPAPAPGLPKLALHEL